MVAPLYIDYRHTINKFLIFLVCSVFLAEPDVSLENNFSRKRKASFKFF